MWPVRRTRHRPLALAVVLFSVLAWLGLGSLTHADATTTSSGDFFAVSPSSKIVDTRSALGVSAALGPASTTSFQVLGQGGVPSSGVSAVSLVIKAVNATSAGSYLEMWPDGTTKPYPASTVNFSSSATTSNSAIVAVGSDGKIGVYNSNGSVDLVVDVNGYFTAAGGDTSPGGYVPVTQDRIVDTRDGTGAPDAKIAPGGTLNVQIDGVDGVADESSVYANITVPASGTVGTLYAYATGGSTGEPTVDYKSVTTSQGAVVPVGTDGQITLKNGSSTQSVDVVIDIYGYFTQAPSSGGVFTAAQDRLLDTRTSTAVPANSSISVTVGGNDGIPTSFGAAVLNLTTTGQQNAGYLRVWPTGQAMPSTTSVGNFQPGTSTADLVIAQPGTQGAVSIYNASSGTIQLIVDLQGWFSSDQVPATPDPTDTAPDPTVTDPGPKPSGAVSVSPGTTLSGTPASTSTAPATGPATIGGKFTNGSGAPQQNLSVSVAAIDGVPDDGSEAQEPVVGTATTGTDGTWSLTLPDPLPSTVQTLADANNGVLNLEATATGTASDGTFMIGTDFLSAGTVQSSDPTTASAEVQADAAPHTTPMYVDTVTTDVDNTPTDAQAATSDASHIIDDPSDATEDFSALPTWQSATGDRTAYSATVLNGTDYSAATISPMAAAGACHNNATTLHSKIAYTTVGEAHAYWDAKASFDYTDTMSSGISLAVSINQSKWTLSGESTETGSIGHSTGFSGKGPYFARQWQVPILYKYQRVHTVCAHQNTRVWYRILPSGYKIPAGGAVGRYGKDVSSKDGLSKYLSSNSKWRNIVAPGSYFGLVHGHTDLESHGVSVWGVGLKVSTTYDTKHTQKIEVGNKHPDHDIWGGHGPLDGNPGVFYSY